MYIYACIYTHVFLYVCIYTILGVDVICAEMVSNPMQLLAQDGGSNQYDEIQFLLTIR